LKGTLSGLRAWLVQRLTAVYMAVYIPVMLAWFASDAPYTYEFWHAWITRTDVSISTFLFFTALLLHAWVGIRDVILDYLQPMVVRIPALAIVGFSLFGMDAWVARILLFP
jgi:succinate dehydrogenase / fumarate reductase membrane anchor subunit